MAVTGKKVDYKDYEHKAGSKLSRQEYITKPENREHGTKQSSPEAANKTLRKVFGS